MAPRPLTSRNLPKIGQSREAEPSTVNEKAIADFTRVVEQTESPTLICSGFALRDTNLFDDEDGECFSFVWSQPATAD
jgi:hypothetical protein